MRSESIISLLLLIPILIVQITVVPLISIGSTIPDLVLILLVFYAIKNGQIYGTVLGFIYGFLFDMITGTLLGSAALSKTLAGFTAGYFSNENKIDFYLKPYIFPLIVFLCGVIDSIVFSLFVSIDLRKNIILLFFEQGMLPGFYSAAISSVIIIFHPKRRLF